MGGSGARLDALLESVLDEPVQLLFLQECASLNALAMAGWHTSFTGISSTESSSSFKGTARAAVAVHPQFRQHTVAFRHQATHVAGLRLINLPSLPTGLAIFSVYLPPLISARTRLAELDRALADIEAMLDECDDKPRILLAGDFNITSGPWAPDFVIQHRNGDSLTAHLVDWVESQDLVCYTPPNTVTCSTSHGRGTTIDLTFGNLDASAFRLWDWIDRVDHFPITFSIPLTRASDQTPTPRPCSLAGIQWDRFPTTLHRHLTTAGRHADSDNQEVADAWTSTRQALVRTLEECRAPLRHPTQPKLHGPSHKSRRSNRRHAWAWTADCQAAARHRADVFRQLDLSLDPTPPGKPRRAYIKLHPDYRQAQREFRRARRAAKNASMLSTLGTVSTAQEWQKFEILLRRKPFLSCASPDLRDNLSRVYHTPSEKCNLFASHFFAVSQSNVQLSHDEPILPSIHNAPLSATGLAPVRLPELRAAIDGLLPGKAAGPDDVGPDLIKRSFTSCDTFREHLLPQISACLEHGTFPSIWKHAHVTIIGKPGQRDPRSPTSYRPISLLCVISKVAESLVKVRLQWELARRGLLQHQYTAVPGISTTHALAVLLQKGRDAIRQKREVALLSIDVGGAFNQIEHAALEQRLHDLGLPSYAHWVRAWLHDRTVAVRFEGHLSDTIHLGSRGVPQGSPLSPLLWCLFLDSFFDQISQHPEASSWETGAYMDDLFVLVTAPTKSTLRRRTQQWLDSLNHWCAMRGLTLDKPAYLVATATPASLTPTPAWHDLQDTPTSQVDLSLQLGNGDRLAPSRSPIRILGVDIGYRLTLHEHIRRKCLTTQALAHRMRWLMREVGALPLSTRLKLAQAYLFPILDYGSPLHSRVRRGADEQLVARTEKAIYSFILNIQATPSFPSGQALAHEVGLLHTLTRWRLQALLFGFRVQQHPLHASSNLARDLMSTVSANLQTPLGQHEELTSFGPGDLITLPAFESAGSVSNAPKLGPLRLIGRSLPFSPVEQIPSQPTPPWQWSELDISILDRDKAILSEKTIRSASTRFAARVYTDGSYSPASLSPPHPAKLGAAGLLIASHPPTRLQSLAGLDGDRWGILEAELHAILLGLRLCQPQPGHRGWNRIDVFTDSQSALQRLGCTWTADSRSLRHLTLQIRAEIASLRSRFAIPIRFWWVPGHSDVPGNEDADRLAAEAASREPDTPPPAYSGATISEWAKQTMHAFDNHSWPFRASRSLLQVSPTFSPTNFATYNGLNWRLTWLLLKFRSGTLPFADHRVPAAGHPQAACQCGAAWQDREHLLLRCHLILHARQLVLRHFAPSLHNDLGSILCGGSLADSDRRPTYLLDLQRFLSAAMKVLRETCNELGVFNRARSALSHTRRDLTSIPLTFLPDSPPPPQPHDAASTSTSRHHAAAPNTSAQHYFLVADDDSDNSSTSDSDSDVIILSQPPRTDDHRRPLAPRAVTACDPSSISSLTASSSSLQIAPIPPLEPTSVDESLVSNPSSINPDITIISDSSDNSVTFIGIAD